jgi:hypothetical protein
VNTRISGAFQHTTQTTTNHRDVILSVLLCGHIRLSEQAEMSLVVGPSVVFEDSVSQTRVHDEPFGSSVTTAPADSVSSPMDLSRRTTGVTGGVAFSFKVRPHLEVVPQARLHVIQRETNLSFPTGDVALLDLAPVVVRPALEVRLRF